MSCRAIVNEILGLPYKVEIRKTEIQNFVVYVYLKEDQTVIWNFYSDFNNSLGIAYNLSKWNFANYYLNKVLHNRTYFPMENFPLKEKLLWSSDDL